MLKTSQSILFILFMLAVSTVVLANDDYPENVPKEYAVAAFKITNNSRHPFKFTVSGAKIANGTVEVGQSVRFGKEYDPGPQQAVTDNFNIHLAYAYKRGADYTCTIDYSLSGIMEDDPSASLRVTNLQENGGIIPFWTISTEHENKQPNVVFVQITVKDNHS